MRTTRLRQKIKKFLDERGEANTTEILEHVNSTMRHGTTPQQLGNVLSKDKDILKVSTTKRGGPYREGTKFVSGRFALVLWKRRSNQDSSLKSQSPLLAKPFILALWEKASLLDESDFSSLSAHSERALACKALPYE